MVGPGGVDSNVLRATEGERFVVKSKGGDFFGEFLVLTVTTVDRKSNFSRLRIFFMRSYILSRKSCLRFRKRDNRDHTEWVYASKEMSSTEFEKAVAKNFSITIMRLPSLEAMIAGSEALKIRFLVV